MCIRDSSLASSISSTPLPPGGGSKERPRWRRRRLLAVGCWLFAGCGLLVAGQLSKDRDDLSGRDRVTGTDLQFDDLSIDGGTHLVLHLHGFEYTDRVADPDVIAAFDVDLDDGSLHGGGDNAGVLGRRDRCTGEFRWLTPRSPPRHRRGFWSPERHRLSLIHI